MIKCNNHQHHLHQSLNGSNSRACWLVRDPGCGVCSHTMADLGDIPFQAALAMLATLATHSHTNGRASKAEVVTERRSFAVLVARQRHNF